MQNHQHYEGVAVISMKDVIVIGSGGHAKVAVDILEMQGKYLVAGLLDDFRRKGECRFGHEVVGNIGRAEDICKRLGIRRVFIGIGDNWERYTVYKDVRSKCMELLFVKAIHPSSIIARDAEIGEGTVVVAGAIINRSCKIGSFCIVNTGATIDHDCYLGDFSSVAPRVCLGGNVSLGEYSAVSIGATVTNRVHIGHNTIVGAGATVLKNVPDEVLSYGTPSRVIRSREVGEKYV